MTDVTQPRMARGTKLSAGILAAALFALLAFAPFASAAPDPVGSGSTTITLKSGVVNAWKKSGVTLSKVSPAKLKGSKATFTVTGGSIDPLTGLGTVNLGGGLKFKAGKKSTAVKSLVLDTTTKALIAKVAGSKMKMAKIAGFSFARNGFGVNLTVKSLKLTSSAAKQLNKKLGFGAKKAKGKSKGKASASKGSSGPFKANQVFGSAASEAQPSTVTVAPGGNVTLATDATTLAKLEKVKVKTVVGAPTTEGPKGSFLFPITGGTVGPTGTAGVVQTNGGVVLVQKIQTGATTFLETEITLGNFYVDLAAKTVSVEVVAKSNASPSLNLGNVGRASIADLNLAGATVTADPATRTVSVQNAAATLQVVAAEVLNGFVEVYKGFEAKGGPPVGPEPIVAGAPLGTISFTAQTQ
jgi:Htaa